MKAAGGWRLVPCEDAVLSPEEQAQVAALERMLEEITTQVAVFRR